MIFKNKTVAILGLGRTGLTSARALGAWGAQVWAWDDSLHARERAAEKGVPLQDLSTIDWQEVDFFLLSPGIPHSHPAPHPLVAQARRAGVQPISDIECLLRNGVAARVIAVTGTNGKSTTSALLAHVLEKNGLPVALGGNIGLPVLDLTDPGEGGFFVLELSSFQLDLTPSLKDHIAVILNISPDHLDRHGGMEGYVASKSRALTQANAAVLGIDFWTKKLGEDFAKTGKPCIYLTDERILAESETQTLRGLHNRQNMAAVRAVLELLGMPEAAQHMTSFPGLSHRQQWLGEKRGIAFVNDSKATSPEAAVQALKAWGNFSIYWIAGGRPKEGKLDALERLAPKVASVFLIGEASEAFCHVFASWGMHVDLSQTLEVAFQRAVSRAQSEGKPHPLILLSPACVSFDQFKDFEARGNAFIALFESWQET